MPAARATATQWIRWLVEPPVASSATIAVHDHPLVHQPPDRQESPPAIGTAGERQHPVHRLAGEPFAQAGVRVHEGRAGHVQAHRLEQHLVAVGGAVEGAGARAVVGGRLGLQQLGAADQALRIVLAHLGLGIVRQPAAHRPGRHEHAGQVPEMQRTDQQARHDLVAHAEQQRGIEHVVGQRDRGRHRDGVAREQAQLHAGQALGHAVAHGGHTAGHLHRGTQAARLVADLGREALVGLVGRQHVVVGGDDADVRRLLGHHAELVLPRQRGKGMRHVRATHAVGAARPVDGGLHAGQVGLAQRLAALTDALGDVGDGRMHGAGRHGPRCNRGVDFDVTWLHRQRRARFRQGVWRADAVSAPALLFNPVHAAVPPGVRAGGSRPARCPGWRRCPGRAAAAARQSG